jgi:hypothetical protein
MKKTISVCILLSVCSLAYGADTFKKLNAMGADRRANERLRQAQNTGTKVPRSYTTNASATTQRAVSQHNTHVAINGGKKR